MYEYRITGRSIKSDIGLAVCVRRKGNPRDHELIRWFKVVNESDVTRLLRIDIGTLLDAEVQELKRRSRTGSVFILSFQLHRRAQDMLSRTFEILIEELSINDVREPKVLESRKCEVYPD